MTTPDIVEPEVEEIEVVDLQSEEPQAVRRQATQDSRVANDIREARRMILKLGELPEAATMMAEHAYDEARLDEGMALYQAAFETFDARSDAITHKQHAAAQLRGADLTAREIYADYKGVCRVFFPEEPEWTALAVEGTTPRPRNSFILKAPTQRGSARPTPRNWQDMASAPRPCSRRRRRLNTSSRPTLLIAPRSSAPRIRPRSATPPRMSYAPG